MPDTSPVTMPILALGHMAHHSVILVWSEVASLSPFFVRGCLPTLLQSIFLHVQCPDSVGVWSGRTSQPLAAYSRAKFSISTVARWLVLLGWLLVLLVSVEVVVVIIVLYLSRVCRLLSFHLSVPFRFCLFRPRSQHVSKIRHSSAQSREFLGVQNRWFSKWKSPVACEVDTLRQGSMKPINDSRYVALILRTLSLFGPANFL